MNIKLPTQGRTPTIENRSSSSSSSNTDDDHNDDRGNQTAWLTRKWKRFPPTKQHIRLSNTTSKQRLKHNVRSAKQRRLSSSGGRPFSNRPLALKPLSAPPYSGYDAKICYSDDSSDDSSGNRVRHLESIKRPMSTVRPYRPRKHKRKRSQGTADKDNEYEVEKILNARVHCKNYSTGSNG
ncbi:hypothetical protein EJ02DRAFT_460679 [Clathrospora elynae]|uniref:Uncharacterized protein n=1 Tax=Clathrospora elynae TaxID=706981 RepID=A0A6A5S5R3_9PLEO|nr:hypothetical protein EJ02DRAFT_460679 [Clathrospora elynae]